MEICYDKIAKLPLFDRITASEITSMLRCIGGFTKTYDHGNYILTDGSAVECVGLVLSGKVHMIKEDVWGGKTILAVLEPGQIFGETYVFGGVSKSTVSFQAVENTEVLFLPFHRVLHTCSKTCAYHQRLVDNMVALIARKNVQLTEKLEITTKRSLRTKILTYLSQEAQKNNSVYFTIPLGRIEMAEYLCVDRSALTRELTRMKEEGLLDYCNNTFRLFEQAQSLA